MMKSFNTTGLCDYQDRKAPASPLYLLIFDRRSKSKKAAWEKRITWEENVEGVTVVGL